MGSTPHDNERQGGWLIFYTHDVRNHPSIVGCQPAELDALVKAAATSGNDVLTVRNALSALVGEDGENELDARNRRKLVPALREKFTPEAPQR